MRNKVLLITVLLLSSIFANATIHVVKVSDFQFSPKRVNALVGDTIKWVWKSGFHTTSSTKVPNNATTWDASMNSNDKVFLYTLTKSGTYKYQCNIHPTAMMGVIKVTKDLSAGFNDFEISQDENASAILNWKINSDKNIAYYSVQRSTDGENFNEISHIKPTQTESSYKIYHFNDQNPDSKNQYVYYMIEIVDKSGQSQLSEIKIFEQKTKDVFIKSLSPNPISSPAHLMIQFNADKEGTMFVQFYNEAGKLFNQTEMSAVKGINNGHFYLGNIPPGNYYIVCSLGSRKEKQIILVK